MARLTKKQERFVEEYLIDLNATAAARRAGYSAKTADRIGPELLGKTCVSEAITEAMAARSERTEVTQDQVVRELAGLAFREGEDEFRHSDKLRALELLGKHLGMFKEKEQEIRAAGIVMLAPVMDAPEDVTPDA